MRNKIIINLSMVVGICGLAMGCYMGIMQHNWVEGIFFLILSDISRKRYESE